MKTIVPVLLLLFFYCQNLTAQQKVFNVGIIGGFNIAQIATAKTGFYERHEFYQKTHHGFNIGILSTVQVTENSQIGMEFLISQNGKYLKTNPIVKDQDFDIFINYLEVPVHYNWQSNLSRKKDFNNFHFEAGLAFARLIPGSSKFVRNKINSDPNFFKRDRALLVQTGMTLLITEKFGFNIKASVPAGIDWTGLTFAGRWVYLFR